MPGNTTQAHAACLATHAKWDVKPSLDTIDQIIRSGYIDMIDVTT